MRTAISAGIVVVLLGILLWQWIVSDPYHQARAGSRQLCARVDAIIGSGNTPQEKYWAAMDAAAEAPRLRLTDDPMDDALQYLSDQLHGLATSDPRILDLALEELAHSSNENRRQCAWHLGMDARNELPGLGAAILAAYEGGADGSNRLHFLWNAGLPRDSSSALRMADLERSVLKCEKDSRQRVRDARTAAAEIHRFFADEAAVPDSRERVFATLLEVAAEPDITREERSHIVAVLTRWGCDARSELLRRGVAIE
jgi:hypothetical protein